jgi:flagellar hook-basal body complex protein FliE
MDSIELNTSLPRLEELPGETTAMSDDGEETTSFGQILKKAVSDVDSLQKEANQSIEDLVTGREKDIHNTMIAMKKAEVSLKLMLSVRNKVLTAYDEIKRMQF